MRLYVCCVPHAFTEAINLSTIKLDQAIRQGCSTPAPVQSGLVREYPACGRISTVGIACPVGSVVAEI